MKMPPRLLIILGALVTVWANEIHSRLDGPNAGDADERIEVRNFAALQLASLLGMKVDVKPDRSAAEWAVLRGKVRQAVTQELDGK
jgi:hypothetical protein